MTIPTPAPDWLKNAPWLLMRALSAIPSFAAHQVVYFLALASIAYTQSSADPNAWPTFVTAAGVNLVTDLLSRIAHGELTEDQIRDLIQQALDQSELATGAQASEIQQLATQLLAETHLVEHAVRENQSIVLQRLRELDLSYAILLPEMRSQLIYLQTAVDDLPTRTEVASQFARLEQRLPRPAPTIPHSLPNPLADFTGRAAQIDRLLADLKRGGTAAITGIAGMGGVGKTALATVVAHRIAAEFPDGQLFVDLRGTSPQQLSPTDAMMQMIHALLPDQDLHQATEAEIAARYRSLLAGKRALLFLDNAADGGQVEPLLLPPPCAFLITSRHYFVLPNLQPLRLDVLPPDEARALLLAICDRIGDSAATLAKLCGYLPLALRIAASTLAEHADLPVAEYLARLDDKRTRVSRLKRDSKPDQDLDAIFRYSYDQLAPDAQAHWRSLAVFPAPFDLAAAADLWAIEQDAARARIGEFARASLVEFNPDSKRYSLHDLLAAFADPLLAGDERYTAQSRHANHYLQVARTADELYLRGRKSITDGLALFYQEWPHIKAGQGWAATNAATDPQAARVCLQYPDAATYCLDLALPTHVHIAWLDAALAAARQLGDRRGEGSDLGNLGNAYATLGDPRQAITYYDQTLAISREIGDRRGEGSDLGNLGSALLQLGDARQAITYYDQALVISREIGDRRGEGSDLGSLGNAYAALGDARQAITYHEQALVIAREIGDRRGEGTHLGNLGLAYADLGDPRQAVTYHEQALAIAREIGDRRGEGNHLGNLGSAYAALGDARQAITYHEQALVISREIGDRRGEGSDLGSLGNASLQLGDARQAITYYEQALAIARAIGDRRGEGNHLGNLGNAYANLGDPRQAITYHEQALAIARAIGDRRGEGHRLGNLGNAYAALGDPRQAITYHEQALAIAREIGDRRGEGSDLGNLGLAYAALGDPRQAITYYDQALVISREIGDRRGEGSDLGNLGLAYDDLGEARQALTYYEQALVISREIGDRRMEGSALGNLGNAYATLGDARQAITYHEQALVIAREIGDRRGEGTHLGNLGNAYAALGEARQALTYYEQALVISREIGDRRMEGSALGNLGNAYAALGDARQAITYHEQALVIAREIGDRRMLSIVSRNLAELCAKDPSRLIDAESHYRTAIDADPANARNYIGIVSLLRRQNRDCEAIPFLETRITLEPTNPNPPLALSCIHKRLGDLALSQSYAASARPLMAADDWYNLACLESICGNIDAAVEHLQHAAAQDGFDRAWAWQDWDLEWIRGDPRFAEIVGPKPDNPIP